MSGCVCECAHVGMSCIGLVPQVHIGARMERSPTHMRPIFFFFFCTRVDPGFVILFKSMKPVCWQARATSQIRGRAYIGFIYIARNPCAEGGWFRSAEHDTVSQCDAAMTRNKPGVSAALRLEVTSFRCVAVEICNICCGHGQNKLSCAHVKVD